MTQKSTAKRIKDLPNYLGDVALYELSKGIKEGKVNHKLIILAKHKPRSGSANTSVWFAGSDGKMLTTKAFKSFTSTDLEDAFDQLGYRLI